MKKELEQKFYDRWPAWFNRTNPQRSRMCDGFRVGDGWFNILWELCEAIEPLAGPEFEVFQVKEKFGGLRFYVEGYNTEIVRLIGVAESKADETCEYCGAYGELRGEGWMKTLCDQCDSARKVCGPK